MTTIIYKKKKISEQTFCRHFFSRSIEWKKQRNRVKIDPVTASQVFHLIKILFFRHFFSIFCTLKHRTDRNSLKICEAERPRRTVNLRTSNARRTYHDTRNALVLLLSSTIEVVLLNESEVIHDLRSDECQASKGHFPIWNLLLFFPPITYP